MAENARPANETGEQSVLNMADIKALGDAVLTDDAGVAVGFDHRAVERIVAQALWQAASDVEEECSAQAVPCFCGSAKWLRARAERISRALSSSPGRCPSCGGPVPTLPDRDDAGSLRPYSCRCGHVVTPGQGSGGDPS